MQSFGDTICAPITPAGEAASSLIRISGAGAFEIAESRFKPATKLRNSDSHRIIFGIWNDKAGIALDEILIYKFIAPHSYTGEDVIELSCHGNPRLVSQIMEDLLLDCRMALPGEFTQRAYLNGKLDLIRAEAVNDLITASGSKAASSALSQLRGTLTGFLETLLKDIQTCRIKIELAIDFSDQDLPQIDLDAFATELDTIIGKAEKLVEESRSGRYVREGIKICLVGPPNAGKSSLFNAFLRENRALVSPHPGTTRDYLEESVSLAGYSLVIYDTAGLRDASDEVERMGIDRTRELLNSADLVLVLQEPGQSFRIDGLIDSQRILNIITKIDSLGFTALPAPADLAGKLKEQFPAIYAVLPDELIPISVMMDGGLAAISAEILKRLELPRELPEGPMLTNSRHLAAIRRSISALHKAREAMQGNLGYEFIAFDLIEASSAINEILGTGSVDDLLGSIFSDFCIGK